jgi:hypothetical protein
VSIVNNGPLQGQSIKMIFDEYNEELLGSDMTNNEIYADMNISSEKLK